MTSQVNICNLAYAALGHKAFIQDINESSVEARYAKLQYDVARKATLRIHPWNFATGRATLALTADTSTTWQYVYALPALCLKARYIVPVIPTEKIPFEVALSNDGLRRVLYTNIEDAELVYTVNVENPDLFDALFVDAFSLNLAQRLSPVIAPNKAQEMLTKFLNTMRSAQASDASEGEPDVIEQTSWLEARISAIPEYRVRVEAE